MLTILAIIIPIVLLYFIIKVINNNDRIVRNAIKQAIKQYNLEIYEVRSVEQFRKVILQDTDVKERYQIRAWLLMKINGKLQYRLAHFLYTIYLDGKEEVTDID